MYLLLNSENKSLVFSFLTLIDLQVMNEFNMQQTKKTFFGTRRQDPLSPNAVSVLHTVKFLGLTNDPRQRRILYPILRLLLNGDFLL